MNPMPLFLQQVQCQAAKIKDKGYRNNLFLRIGFLGCFVKVKAERLEVMAGSRERTG